MSTSFHTEEGKSLHHSCTDWANEKMEINSSNLSISLQTVSGWRFMVTSVTTHELGNWCVKFATIFSEKWSWGSFYFSTLTLKSVTEGIVHWCNSELKSEFLSVRASIHTDSITFEGTSRPSMGSDKVQMPYIHTYIRKKSFGDALYWVTHMTVIQTN